MQASRLADVEGTFPQHTVEELTAKSREEQGLSQQHHALVNEDRHLLSNKVASGIAVDMDTASPLAKRGSERKNMRRQGTLDKMLDMSIDGLESTIPELSDSYVSSIPNGAPFKAGFERWVADVQASLDGQQRYHTIQDITSHAMKTNVWFTQAANMLSGTEYSHISVLLQKMWKSFMMYFRDVLEIHNQNEDVFRREMAAAEESREQFNHAQHELEERIDFLIQHSTQITSSQDSKPHQDGSRRGSEVNSQISGVTGDQKNKVDASLSKADFNLQVSTRRLKEELAREKAAHSELEYEYNLLKRKNENLNQAILHGLSHIPSDEVLQARRSTYKDLDVDELLSIVTKAQGVDEIAEDIENTLQNDDDTLARLSFIIRKLQREADLQAASNEKEESVQSKERELKAMKRKVFAVEGKLSDANDRISSLQAQLKEKKAEIMNLITKNSFTKAGTLLAKSKSVPPESSPLSPGVGRGQFGSGTTQLPSMPTGWPGDIARMIETSGVEAAVRAFGASKVDELFQACAFDTSVLSSNHPVETSYGISILRVMVAAARGDIPGVLKEAIEEFKAAFDDAIANSQISSDGAYKEGAIVSNPLVISHRANQRTRSMQLLQTIKDDDASDDGQTDSPLPGPKLSMGVAAAIASAAGKLLGRARKTIERKKQDDIRRKAEGLHVSVAGSSSPAFSSAQKKMRKAKSKIRLLPSLKQGPIFDSVEILLAVSEIFNLKCRMDQITMERQLAGLVDGGWTTPAHSIHGMVNLYDAAQMHFIKKEGLWTLAQKQLLAFLNALDFSRNEHSRVFHFHSLLQPLLPSSAGGNSVSGSHTPVRSASQSPGRVMSRMDSAASPMAFKTHHRPDTAIFMARVYTALLSSLTTGIGFDTRAIRQIIKKNASQDISSSPNKASTPNASRPGSSTSHRTPSQGSSRKRAASPAVLQTSASMIDISRKAEKVKEEDLIQNLSSQELLRQLLHLNKQSEFDAWVDGLVADQVTPDGRVFDVDTVLDKAMERLQRLVQDEDRKLMDFFVAGDVSGSGVVTWEETKFLLGQLKQSDVSDFEALKVYSEISGGSRIGDAIMPEAFADSLRKHDMAHLPVPSHDQVAFANA